MMNFNPLSRQGERLGFGDNDVKPMLFQSTLPTRGETLLLIVGLKKAQNFNPLSRQGERLYERALQDLMLQFQSTLPTRGETTESRVKDVITDISIHSPDKGRD